MVLKKLFKDAHCSVPVQYRPVDPEKDFEAAYAIFKETISPSVMALNGGTWPEDERRPFFKKGFREDGMSMLLHKGQPIGCFCITVLNLPVREEEKRLFAQDSYDAVILQRMYIKPEYQKQGIGSAIMGMALTEAHKRRLPLELEVLANNESAIHAYKKYGYEPYKLVVNGWNQKLLMRHKDTTQYLPYRQSPGASPFVA